MIPLHYFPSTSWPIIKRLKKMCKDCWGGFIHFLVLKIFYILCFIIMLKKLFLPGWISIQCFLQSYSWFTWFEIDLKLMVLSKSKYCFSISIFSQWECSKLGYFLYSFSIYLSRENVVLQLMQLVVIILLLLHIYTFNRVIPLL